MMTRGVALHFPSIPLTIPAYFQLDLPELDSMVDAHDDQKGTLRMFGNAVELPADLVDIEAHLYFVIGHNSDDEYRDWACWIMPLFSVGHVEPTDEGVIMDIELHCTRAFIINGRGRGAPCLIGETVDGLP